ncbi:sulfur protein 4, mitochondrial [Seminavis robusta]|uniref:NADH dehydrogenase [ubiquinone] iron-sulfur protein 4, mitochondrial n=1 Tax=Seminavis robusta TaxID=568900 RepID=A0A9N8EIM0_9STRA|nr:sulfur protein 4, mitochondrial [Seminavis robusta]|eukprot:Sro1231_g254640.1 sulfur protein 4, mitochondrial (266) ;mRNA; r:25433-26230
MLSLRPALRTVALARHLPASQAVAFRGWMQKHPFSSKDVVEQGDEEEDAVAIVQSRRDDLTGKGKHLVWESRDQLPAAPLPEDPKELLALDPADTVSRLKADGTDRFAFIRQDKANVKQSPLNDEKKWRISFVEDGLAGEKWENSLMGWTSSADPYQSEPPLVFENALDAVYFAKKRGWNYIVKEPIMRQVRDDGAQYQDNFLPQAVAARVAKERTQCDQWKREAAGASHYYRPLRYHGQGVVPQYGTNPDADSAPPVESYYKLR